MGGTTTIMPLHLKMSSEAAEISIHNLSSAFARTAGRKGRDQVKWVKGEAYTHLATSVSLDAF